MDWQKRYQNNDTPWDKKGPAPELVRLLKEKKDLFNGISKALVPGCGTGHDVAILAKWGIDTTGLDISEKALESAAQTYPHEKIQWQLGDLFLDLKKAYFDLVWEHTCFCAIAPSMRGAYVECIANTLKPGGFLLGIFFIETDVDIEDGPPYKASKDEILQLFSCHFSLEYQATPVHFYPDRNGKEHLFLFRLRKD